MKRLASYIHFRRVGFGHRYAWKYSKPTQYRRVVYTRNVYNTLFELMTAVMGWVLCACGVVLCVVATYVLLRHI